MNQPIIYALGTISYFSFVELGPKTLSNLSTGFQNYLDTEGNRSGLSGDNSGLAPEEAEMAAAAAVRPDTNPYEFKGS